MVNKTPPPLYLLADSQLLFWKADSGQYFFKDEIQRRGLTVQRAVYIGASNEDVDEYYDLFQSAMNANGISDCYFLKSTSNLDEAIRVLQQADLILLSGGDVSRGWQFLKSLKLTLEDCYKQGALFIGISAGAIHLSALGSLEKEVLLGTDMFSTLGFTQCLVGAHEEGSNWEQLKQMMALTDGCFRGLGIPLGGAVVVEYDGSITAIRKSIPCFDYDGSHHQSTLELGAKGQLFNSPSSNVEDV